MKLLRKAWVVQTPQGFLGQRRYNYAAGTTTSTEKSDFKYARIYTRLKDAESACAPDDRVIQVTITT